MSTTKYIVNNVLEQSIDGSLVVGQISATTISGDTIYDNGYPVKPYKVYTALLTQTGSTAPEVIVLENTLEFNPSWEYFEPGKYGFNFPTPPDYNKIVVLIGPVPDYTNFVNVNTDYNILVRSNGNDFLDNTPVEIRVYK